MDEATGTGLQRLTGLARLTASTPPPHPKAVPALPAYRARRNSGGGVPSVDQIVAALTVG